MAIVTSTRSPWRSSPSSATRSRRSASTCAADSPGSSLRSAPTWHAAGTVDTPWPPATSPTLQVGGPTSGWAARVSSACHRCSEAMTARAAVDGVAAVVGTAGVGRRPVHDDVEVGVAARGDDRLEVGRLGDDARGVRPAPFVRDVPPDAEAGAPPRRPGRPARRDRRGPRPPAAAPSWPRRRRRGRPSCRCCRGRRAVRRAPRRRTGRRSTRRPRARRRCVPSRSRPGPSPPARTARRFGRSGATSATSTANPRSRHSLLQHGGGRGLLARRVLPRGPHEPLRDLDELALPDPVEDASLGVGHRGSSGGAEPVDGAGEALHAVRDALRGRGGEADPQRVGEPLAR